MFSHRVICAPPSTIIAADLELLSGERFVAGAVVDAQIAGAREVESDGGQIEDFGAPLLAILGARDPEERVDPS